ncbi:hypothetical protein PCAR4_760008 [Paraburkholderia caribensis]|nr:hypothetical protein PCAR4_760008 [Paraburkholderia caribensis]
MTLRRRWRGIATKHTIGSLITNCIAGYLFGNSIEVSLIYPSFRGVSTRNKKSVAGRQNFEQNCVSE